MTPTPRALDLEAEIKTLYESGLSNPEIAEQVGRSVSRVKGHIYSMIRRGIMQPVERNVLSPERQDFDRQLTELHNQGLKPSEIAARLGKPRDVTANRIYQLIRTGRLQKHPDSVTSKPTERRDREAAELRARQAAPRPDPVELPVRPWRLGLDNDVPGLWTIGIGVS